MLSVFKRVKAVFDAEYSGKRKNFREGFRTCYELFQIGYSKTAPGSFEAELYATRAEVEALRYRNKKLDKLLSEKGTIVHSLKQELTKTKEDLLELKAAKTEELLEAATHPLNKEIHTLTSEVNQLKNRIKQTADVIANSTAAEHKMQRLTELFLSWMYISKSGSGKFSKMTKKAAAQASLEKKILHEAAKAERKVAA